MKTISKKIKTIYLLAIMAILSICVAVFPVFNTETVKAEGATGLSIAGAELEMGKADKKENTADDFAFMFQAEITSDLYAQIAERNAKFGMAIGNKATMANVSSYDQLADLKAKGSIWYNDAIVGTATSGAKTAIDFVEGEDSFIYKAGTFFDKSSYGFTPEQIASFDWTVLYSTELTAIPYYIVDDVVNFDASLAFTTSASALAMELLEKETALPMSEASITPEQVAAITGKEFRKVYSGVQIYLDQSQDIFLSNQQAGGGQYYGLSAVRYWFPYEQNKTSSSFLSKASYDARIMGGKFKTKTPTSWTKAQLTLTADHLERFDLLDTLVPGEKYICYYTNVKDTYNGVTQTADIEWFEYEVATRVFTSLTTPTSAQGSEVGQRILAAKTMLEGGSGTNKGSYFALGLNGSTIYLPYQHTADAYVYEQENYGGHYILATDIIVPSPIEGSTHKLTGSSADSKTYGTHAAPSNQTTVRAQTIGALKDLPSYINAINASITPGFTGSFDGKGHTIEASFQRGGLFGVIKGGTVKNLNIKADLYAYDLSGTTVTYTKESYNEKASILAEYIYGGTIENVQVELKESAPATFVNYQQDGGAQDMLNTPEMNNVPGLLASQGIQRATLRNVIVKLDSLKDAGNSIQNFRSALNVADNCKLENVFVVGSSYSNMSIEVIEDTETGTTEYVMTLSVPKDKIEPGTYAGTADGMGAYAEMAIDMFKYMKNIDVTAENVKIKFVDEPATMHFADEDAFQAYMAEKTSIRQTFTRNGIWKLDAEGKLVWGKADTIVAVAGSKGYTMAAKPTPVKTDLFQWGIEYNPSVTVAG